MTRSIHFGSGRQLTYNLKTHPAGDVISEEWVGDQELRQQLAAHMAKPEGGLWMEHFALATQAATAAGIEWSGPFSSGPEPEFDSIVGDPPPGWRGGPGA